MLDDMRADTQQINEKMYFRSQKVLQYTMQYPKFSSTMFFSAAAAMNRHYRGKYAVSRQQLRQSLYHQAVRAFEHAAQNGASFHPFEAVYTCTVTYCQGCTVSMYFDVYRYTGTEDSSKVRSADTWDLACGRRVGMAQFFAPSAAYKEYVIDAVTAQIAAQKEEKRGGYFDDFAARAKRYFNTNSFYLAPEGLIVFYQPYQLMPHAGWLPQYLLPFSNDVKRPRANATPKNR